VFSGRRKPSKSNNIERNLVMNKELKQAILDGAQQIAVPHSFRRSPFASSCAHVPS